MNCHCCDGTYEKYKDFSDVFQCMKCEHIFRNYSGDLAEYHKSEYRKKFKTYPLDERKKYSSNLLKFFNSFLTIDDDLLEIGSGDGFMANMIEPFVGEVTALEINPDLTKQTEDRYPNLDSVCADFLKFEHDKYNLVYAIDVLEHVENVREFVLKASSVSQKYVLIQVPTNRGIYSPNPKFDGHCHYFTPNSLSKLFDKFKLIKSKLTARHETSRGQALLALFEIKC